MSTPFLTANTSAPPSSAESRGQRRTFITLGVVGVFHLVLLAALLHESHPKLLAPPEPKVVSVELITLADTNSAPPSPQAKPVPQPPVPQPPPPKPLPTPPKKIEHRPTPRTLSPTPTPVPVVAPAPEAPAPVVSAPVAPPAPPVAPAGPSLASSAPKNVQHIDCHIDIPLYPTLSRANAESGKVIVAITVGVQGNVESAVVRTSSNYPRLDAAARETALAGRCHPYLENGQPLRATVLQPFTFKPPDDD